MAAREGKLVTRFIQRCIPTFAGHVSFAEGTTLEPDHVHVVSSTYHNPEAHIGMLRNHHTYQVDIPVTHQLGKNVTLDQPNYNLYVRCLGVGDTTEVVNGASTDYKTMVTIEVKTIKDGRIREKVFLVDVNNSEKKMEVR